MSKKIKRVAKSMTTQSKSRGQDVNPDQRLILGGNNEILIHYYRVISPFIHLIISNI